MIDGKRHIAIMQPYFFPYIGSWQLIQAISSLMPHITDTMRTGMPASSQRKTKSSSKWCFPV